ncbi:MAG: hypothetical protein K2X55_24345 [Burkholderiaceae bacterium]|nr:hypothetical protein [Burkholderiaceae bacterium]
MSLPSSLAVPKSDLRLFPPALQAYQERARTNEETALEMEIVSTYPDVEYKLVRDIAALFGFDFFCVSYSGTFPGFTDRHSIFVKNIERGSPDFRPVWTGAHELCHLFENAAHLHLPALTALKQLVSDDAWEKRRAIEDNDVETDFRAMFDGGPEVEIDRSTQRQAYVWNEVIADCYASMWADPSFWDGLKSCHPNLERAQDFVAVIERLSAASRVTPVISYPSRTWYPAENREKVRVIMTQMTAAYLSPT